MRRILPRLQMLQDDEYPTLDDCDPPTDVNKLGSTSDKNRVYYKVFVIDGGFIIEVVLVVKSDSSYAPASSSSGGPFAAPSLLFCSASDAFYENIMPSLIWLTSSEFCAISVPVSKANRITKVTRLSTILEASMTSSAGP